MSVDDTIVYPSVEANACPYPFFADARRDAPVYRPPGRDEYLVTRHADITEVLRHPEIFSSVSVVTENGLARAGTLADLGPDRVSGMLTTDPPQHTLKRRIASEPFKPKRIRAYEPMVAEIVDRLIDGFASRGSCEFVSEFATRLPALTILDILGLPADDAARTIVWGNYDGQGSRFHPIEEQEAIASMLRDVGAYLRECVTSRIASPRDDGISEYIQGYRDTFGEIDLPNLILDVGNVLFGGIITTGHMLGNAMNLLLTHPDQLAKVLADRSLFANVVEEALRMESPVQWQGRLAVVDAEIAGVPIPAGAIVLLAYGSGGRDEAVFEAPDTFDVTRENARSHLAFGFHTHFCLGSPLARLEGRLGLDRLFDRLPDLRLAPDGAAERGDRTLIFRGFSRLDLEFTPQPG